MDKNVMGNPMGGPVQNNVPIGGQPGGMMQNQPPMGGQQYQQYSYQPNYMKPKKSNKKWFIIGGIGVAVIAFVIVILSIKLFIPMSNYNDAKEAFENEDYKKANQLYKKAGNYKDAKKQAEKSLNAYNYQHAEYYVEDAKYEEAIECYKEAAGYRDADKKLLDIYMLIGDYRSAYNESPDELKESVLFNNFIAYFCSDAKDSMKSPDSFELRDAWWDETNQGMVMEIDGENSYGEIVTNYWYYTFDTEEKEYSLYTSITDFEKEEYYSWDDTDDTIEKILKNAAKDTIYEMVTDDELKIDGDIVSIMNDMQVAEKLEDIELLDETNQKYCVDNEAS